jgi:hypothetical protein
MVHAPSDFEISFRYSTILQRLYEIRKGEWDKNKFDIMTERGHMIFDAVRSLRADSSNSLHPEFKELNMPALHAELSKHSKEPERVEFVDHITHQSLNAFEGVNFDDAEAVATVIRRQLIHPRWRMNTNFRYLDCLPPKAGERPTILFANYGLARERVCKPQQGHGGRTGAGGDAALWPNVAFTAAGRIEFGYGANEQPAPFGGARVIKRRLSTGRLHGL